MNLWYFLISFFVVYELEYDLWNSCKQFRQTVLLSLSYQINAGCIALEKMYAMLFNLHILQCHLQPITAEKRFPFQTECPCCFIFLYRFGSDPSAGLKVHTRLGEGGVTWYATGPRFSRPWFDFLWTAVRSLQTRLAILQPSSVLLMPHPFFCLLCRPIHIQHLFLEFPRGTFQLAS